MDLLKKIVDRLDSYFKDEKTLESSRTKEHAFTRKRKLPFYFCLLIGLAHCTGSLAYGIEEFFALQMNSTEFATSSAYSRDREHFDDTPYQTSFKIVRDLLREEYENKDEFKTKFGLQVIAVDGSQIALPNRKHLKEVFGGTGRGAKSPTARMTIVYDTLNDLIYEAYLGPLKVSEREQAKILIEQMNTYCNLNRFVFVFDRGYISEELIDLLDSLGAKYIFRVRKKFNTDIDDLPLGDSSLNYKEQFRRIVKFNLSQSDNDKEIETLFTNLTEPDFTDFQELYYLRWPVETEIDTIKNKIELTNFNGISINSIYQDFWISMTIANLTNVVIHQADKLIESKHRHHKNKYQYQANISEAVNALRLLLVRAFLAQDQTERELWLKQIIYFTAENEVPIIPNRSVARGIIRAVKYHWNRKHH